MVRIALLGGVQAVNDAGEPLDVGTAKAQTLLAMLALSPGAAVPVPRLVDALWGEAPPRTAAKTLQSYVARLRKVLGPETIVRVGAAYRLEVFDDAVDVARFRALLESGEVSAALAEWTGTPLAGLHAPGLTATVDGLLEEWLGAVETELQRHVDVDAATAIGRLTELTAQHPFREGLWALLMTALYRVGRQADALAAFQQARRLLVSELGVEPGRRLRDLEARILEHDPTLGIDEPERVVHVGGHDRPAPHIAATTDRRLPVRLERLIGRHAELDLVADALTATSVVTLIGPGGVGKTRLALAVAQAVQETDDRDVWWVDLAEIADSGDVARSVADALGLRESPARSLSDSIVSGLQLRPTLLVLDNCEHVIDGAAALAQAIAAACPSGRVLASSREPLQVVGERLITVTPLDPSGPGAELFIERASATASMVDAARSRDEIEEICRRLDGLPLAIELAAARTTSHTPHDLLQRLDDRLGLLDHGRRGSTERHRTLRSTIRWSHDLLPTPARTLFAGLAVFAGPFDLAAASVAAGQNRPVAEIDDMLSDLVERSMIVVEPGPFGRRFRLLETIREFAAEQLASGGGTDEAAARHTRWCLEQVAGIGQLLAGPDEVEGVARLNEVWPNLRAAVHRTCAAGDTEVAEALVRPLVAEITLRRRSEIGDWAEQILAALPGDAANARVFWLAWAAHRYMHNRDKERYDALLGRFGEPDHPLIRYTQAYIAEDPGSRGSLLP